MTSFLTSLTPSFLARYAYMLPVLLVASTQYYWNEHHGHNIWCIASHGKLIIYIKVHYVVSGNCTGRKDDIAVGIHIHVLRRGSVPPYDSGGGGGGRSTLETCVPHIGFGQHFKHSFAILFYVWWYRIRSNWFIQFVLGSKLPPYTIQPPNVIHVCSIMPPQGTTCMLHHAPTRYYMYAPSCPHRVLFHLSQKLGVDTHIN